MKMTDQRSSALGGWLLVLGGCVVLAVVAVACGDSESAEVVATSEPRTLVTTGGEQGEAPSEVIALTTADKSTELEPGTYETTSTDRPVQFTIGDGWYLGGQAPWVLGLARGASLPPELMLEVDNLFIGFSSPYLAIPADPLGGRSPDMEWEPVPDDMTAWFEAIPGVEVMDLREVSVGGIDGVRFDLEIGPLPATADCGGVRCVNMAAVFDGLVYSGFKENTTAPIVLLGEGDDRISIAYTAVTPGFEELAEEFIESLEFGP